MSGPVMLETQGAVALLRLDRPPLNVLDAAMQHEIIAAAEEIERRFEIRAVVIYGGERAFAAGADIGEMAALGADGMQAHSRVLQRFTTAVAELTKPTVAVIRGHALGGGLELALAADVRFAATDARLGLPETSLGIIPGAGGTQRLARLLGPARAKDLIFTGRILAAGDAASIGLVDLVTAPEDVLERGLAWAAQFANGPRLAIAAAKRAVDCGLGVDLVAGTEIERSAFTALFSTRDQAAGMQAFLDKTQPVFEGR